MNTKKCIKWLKCARKAAELNEGRVDAVIKKLKEGEVYREMWGEFIHGLAHINTGSYQNPCDKKKTDLECVNKIVKNIRQKYFPKPEETINWKDKFDELEEEFEEREREFIQEIEHWKSKYYNRRV